MSDAGAGHGEQQTYWNQLVLVKVVACYVRRYRDEQARWINCIGIFKAAVTSSTIGAWVIWKDYAFTWAILLGIAQLLDSAHPRPDKAKANRRAVDQGLAAKARRPVAKTSIGSTSSLAMDSRSIPVIRATIPMPKATASSAAPVRQWAAQTGQGSATSIAQDSKNNG